MMRCASGWQPKKLTMGDIMPRTITLDLDVLAERPRDIVAHARSLVASCDCCGQPDPQIVADLIAAVIAMAVLTGIPENVIMSLAKLAWPIIEEVVEENPEAFGAEATTGLESLPVIGRA